MLTRTVLMALAALVVLGSPAPASAPPPSPDAFEREIQAIADRLGSDDWNQREAATRELVGRGEAVAALLEARLRDEPDAEIRQRLRYILGNITPPQYAALLISADPASGLMAGDIITHVNGRPIRTAYELHQRVLVSSAGAILRVRRIDGTHEIGPIENDQIYFVADYKGTRGQRLARVLQLYAGGYVERAHEALRKLEDESPIRSDEFPPSLRACIAYTAGFGDQAFALLTGHEADARAVDPQRSWLSPSTLDQLVGGRAPFHIAWRLFTEGGQAFQQNPADLDLRMQRILVPAHRYLDATARAFELWWQSLRDVIQEDRSQRHVAGNTLAVAGWMLYELGLRSECCRMIEPRSVILRQDPGNPKKWVRVDTDAWLPYLAGDEKGAVDMFYPHALNVLRDPPSPDAPSAVIRNPQVAARIAFFLYQLPQDERIDELIDLVARESHPILREYAHWMLMALGPTNQRIIRRDVQRILPLLEGDQAIGVARAVALLEYIQSDPRPEVFRAARTRAFESAAGRQRDLGVAMIDALDHLATDQPQAALQTLDTLGPAPELAPLRSTAAFRADPPAAAENLEALIQLKLAVPLGLDTQRWVVLTRDLRLMIFDAAAGTLTPIQRPTPSWYPNPLTWPWVSRQASTGRVWAYGRRRVVEIRDDDTEPLRLNIRTEQIAAFDRLAGPVFAELAELVTRAGPPRGEQTGPFLRDEVRAHAEIVADPDLYDVAVMQPLPNAPGLVHIALRDGPQLLAEPKTQRIWTGRWLADRLGLTEPVRFFARAQPTRDESDEPAVWLFSTQGLIRFDPASETATQIALPGEAPHAAVIPESTPYERRDRRFVYCARLPEDGGQVYRVRLDDGSVETVDMINEALPASYYALLSRAEIRARLNKRFRAAGMLGLEELITDAQAVVDALGQTGE